MGRYTTLLSMRLWSLRILFWTLFSLLILQPLTLQADEITIAAAADLRFAMDEVVSDFQRAHPADTVVLVYGSSGNFHAQIRQGAPYDLFFSADIAYAQELESAGFAAAPTRAYATGRIVLWSAQFAADTLSLKALVEPRFTRIAIANPAHAPYGMRAEEALRAAGVWEQVKDKLVLGDNIAQTAQFVQTGNAQVGIIALALALNPELAALGGYQLVEEALHQPLEQGFIITRRAADKPLAAFFADYITSEAARSVLSRHGFILPQ